MTTEAKAKLYKTARLVDPDIAKKVGNLGYVRIAFLGRMLNDVSLASERVFACYRNMKSDSLVGCHFESALTEFCL